MNTPPPTETPAPVSEADIQLSIDWLRGLAGKGGKGVVGNIDARGLGHIAEQLSTLRARNEALTAERDEERGIVDRIWDLFGRPSYAELNGRSIYDLITALQARAESLERRNHDLAQDLQKAESELARLREAVKPVPSPIGQRARRAGEEGPATQENGK